MAIDGTDEPFGHACFESGAFDPIIPEAFVRVLSVMAHPSSRYEKPSASATNSNNEIRI
jgi:hypothetical protein